MVDQYGRVKLTNPDKVLYPATGTTKAQVFDYYLGIAEVMIPHIAGRPVTRKRWPNGVDESSFFEKQLASSAPDWLGRGTIVHKSGTTTYPVIDTVEGVAWLAQQASLEVHVPQWRFVDEHPGPATRLVFDLDPGEGVKMKQLCEVAQAVRDLMDDIGLTTYPLTSGSKGLHLYAPLEEPVSSHGAVVLAKRVAQQLEQQMPKLVTSTMTKSVRTGKVFLDWSQNNASKTTIAPYSLRGREHPTVAAPRTWDEIADPKLRHLPFDEVLERVEEMGDLLAPLDDVVPEADRLTRYRSMRDAGKTPEPVPKKAPKAGNNDLFVIQEHHARRLHYDLRLERDGVLVSWAVPKNLPDTPSVNHLAVHTEDHPIEYLAFHGTIPAGEYGGGKIIIWDTGTYETEKFNDVPPDGRGQGRGGDRHPARRPDRRSVCADPNRWQELACAPDEGAEAARRQAISRRCWPARVRSRSSSPRSGRSKASGTGIGFWSMRITARSICARGAAGTSPTSTPNSSRWQPISPIIT